MTARIVDASWEEVVSALRTAQNQRDALAHAIRELLTKGREDFRWQGSTWTLSLKDKEELGLVLGLNSDAK